MALCNDFATTFNIRPPLLLYKHHARRIDTAQTPCPLKHSQEKDHDGRSISSHTCSGGHNQGKYLEIPSAKPELLTSSIFQSDSGSYGNVFPKKPSKKAKAEQL
jgi:hypothetical protein